MGENGLERRKIPLRTEKKQEFSGKSVCKKERNPTKGLEKSVS